MFLFLLILLVLILAQFQHNLAKRSTFLTYTGMVVILNPCIRALKVPYTFVLVQKYPKKQLCVHLNT